MYRHDTDPAYRAAAIGIAYQAGAHDRRNDEPPADEAAVWADALSEARGMLGLVVHSHPATYGATAADEWSAEIYAAYLAGYSTTED